LCVLLLATFATAPVVAKEGRVLHAHASHRSAKAPSGKAASHAHHHAPATPSNTVGARNGDAAEKSAPVNEPPSLTTAKPRDPNSAKAFTPPKVAARHVTSPASPAGRNAIGITAVLPHQAPTDVHAKTLAPGSVAGLPKPGAVKSSPAGAQPHAMVSASIGNQSGNQGKIGGATAIRPAPAPSGLGGPAKTTLGIDGTATKSKH
jgi:hypothetical protein